ncbi:DEAD/DEAH box family ATP-dependent RNA helicase [Spironucleus salmonicida]|uniref:ATP-dependent RNA helicase n=1 Tax=Spironucleus salmonicida TaxID=348837 RepID=V6LJ62_9EUKA|nr:DEAD/DEAH box family ATP-dependent RNA helicase [Spironucleus salmonicida]|eukprot:EST44650.1 DEAD/DEAH box family ATP-dependent RNA helicase [Spironucleus salmonicida]
MSLFETIILPDQIKENLKQLKYNTFLPIQDQVVNIIQGSNHNILIQSPCGSGKTLACVLPALQQLNQNPFTIILAPTPELSIQHAKYIKKLTQKTSATVHVNEQLSDLNSPLSLLFMNLLPKNPHFLISTPRNFLFSYLKHKNESQSPNSTLIFPKTLIFDEADEILQNHIIITICKNLQIRPQTPLDLMTKKCVPRLIFCSASLLSKFPLLNATRAAPGIQIINDKSTCRQLVSTVDADFMISILIRNSIPLPGIVIFDDLLTLKTAFARIVSFTKTQRLKFAVICIIKGMDFNFDNAVIRSKMPENIPQKCIIMCLSENVRGVDLGFQCAISFVQTVDDAQHSCGRAGRGESGGIRIFCVQEENLEKFEGVEGERLDQDVIGDQLTFFSKNLGQVVLKRAPEEPDEQLEFEELLNDN